MFYIYALCKETISKMTTVLVYLELRSFLEHRTFSVKTRKVPGKWGVLVNLIASFPTFKDKDNYLQRHQESCSRTYNLKLQSCRLFFVFFLMRDYMR